VLCVSRARTKLPTFLFHRPSWLPAPVVAANVRVLAQTLQAKQTVGGFKLQLLRRQGSLGACKRLDAGCSLV